MTEKKIKEINKMISSLNLSESEDELLKYLMENFQKFKFPNRKAVKWFYMNALEKKNRCYPCCTKGDTY